jgi:hypothetical protein
MAVMLKGYELGLSLTSSFELIQVVQGKPALSPRGALALIMQSPLCEKLDIKDEQDKSGVPTACTVTMKRANGMEYSVRFSMDDAKRAGLVKAGGAWEAYPANMLRWRAVGFCADVVFPDVIGGMKRADELGAAISPEGDVIEGAWEAVPATPAQPAQAASTAPSLSALVETYGPEAVMAANGGRIPGTDAELVTVAATLTGETNG